MPTGVGNVTVKSLTLATTDETLGQFIDARRLPYIAFIIEADGGTISSGVVTFEEAYWDETVVGIYTGTWSQITTYDCSALTGSRSQTIIHNFNAVAFQRIRARVSTAIAGGGKISVIISGLGPS
jgi:hypothetical protein